MKVYVCALENYGKKYVDQVLNLFNSVDGVIEFKKIETNRNLQYDYEDLTKLKQDKILEIIDRIRKENEYIGESYVVLLTNKGLDIPIIKLPKEKDWNSVFIHLSIAVNCSYSRWQKITDGKVYLAVAHQIVENVFQALSHMELNSQIQLESVHQETEICVNDYCTELWETKGKIRSGFICQQCKDKALFYNDFRYIEHIEKLLKIISDRLRHNHEYTPSAQDLKVTFDDEGNVFLGNGKIDFKKSKISKVNYLFHLINYDIPLSNGDLKTEKIKTKFLELASVLDHQMTETNYSSHLKNLRCNHNRSNDVIIEHSKSDVLSSYFKIKSQCIEQDIYSYQISSTNNNITIPDYLKKYRIDN
ncbi:hypothetical protein GCM10022217_01540 [Chryseobacterium ginsenosidimutans]|uniref:hypothetical protein n=1 Tax=Chryseobacterium ginsenosidimutans TaxID=687846 RepID=UPI0031DC00F7